MRYRSKPTEVEALQWDAIPGVRDGLVAEDIVAWVNANGGQASIRVDDMPDGAKATRIAVRTINGWAYAAPGHYIVRSAVDFYPCDPDTFSIRWEPVVASSGETE